MRWRGRWPPTEMAIKKINPAGKFPAGVIFEKNSRSLCAFPLLRRQALELLEEVHYFFAGAFGVVHRHFGALLGSFFVVDSSNFGPVTCHFKRLLGPVGGFHRDRLATFSDLRYRPFHDFIAAFADLVYFHGRLFSSRHRVVGNDLRTFLHSL